jgi:hypothetical protein
LLRVTSSAVAWETLGLISTLAAPIAASIVFAAMISAFALVAMLFGTKYLD